MASKPRDESTRNPAAPEAGPAVESVRTTTEAEAAVKKREADTKLGERPPSRAKPRPAGDSPKLHGDKFAGTSPRKARDKPV